MYIEQCCKISSCSFFVGLKAILESNPELKAQIVVFGTPAEEGGGGKVMMINKGCFDDMDICMMSHPSPVDSVIFPCLAVATLKIVYHGEQFHLNSHVLCFNLM